MIKKSSGVCVVVVTRTCSINIKYPKEIMKDASLSLSLFFSYIHPLLLTLFYHHIICGSFSHTHTTIENIEYPS